MKCSKGGESVEYSETGCWVTTDRLRLNKSQKPAMHCIAAANSCLFRIHRTNTYKSRLVPSRRIATENSLQREFSQFFVACERNSR